MKILKDEAIQYLKQRLVRLNQGHRLTWTLMDRAAVSKLLSLAIIHGVIAYADFIYQDLSFENKIKADKFLHQLVEEEKKHA